MPIATILALLPTIIQALPGAITTVAQLKDLATQLFATANGRDPTAAEIASLESAIDSDVAQALEPLPPAQPGDPDYQA